MLFFFHNFESEAPNSSQLYHKYFHLQMTQFGGIQSSRHVGWFFSHLGLSSFCSGTAHDGITVTSKPRCVSKQDKTTPFATHKTVLLSGFKAAKLIGKRFLEEFGVNKTLQNPTILIWLTANKCVVWPVGMTRSSEVGWKNVGPWKISSLYCKFLKAWRISTPTIREGLFLFGKVGLTCHWFFLYSRQKASPKLWFANKITRRRRRQKFKWVYLLMLQKKLGKNHQVEHWSVYPESPLGGVVMARQSCNPGGQGRNRGLLDGKWESGYWPTTMRGDIRISHG